MQAKANPIPQSEAEQIRELNRMLQLGVPALVGPQEERIELPESVYRILKEIVRDMKEGKAITLVHHKEQLTTQAAANFLGCSRPFLIKLLDAGTIPHQKVGLHRRVFLKDLVAYQRERDKVRKAGLNELARAVYAEGEYEGIGVPDGGRDD